MKKSDLHALLAADEIQPCLALLGQAAQTLQHNGLQQEVVLLTSQYENYLKDERSGAVSRDDLLQTRNQLIKTLLSLADSLPEDLSLPAAGTKTRATKLPGIAEDRFKRQIFFFMLAAKCWIVFWVIFHRDNGGFTNGETLATIALLLPAFTAYTSVMFGDFLQRRDESTQPATAIKLVSRTVQTVAYFAFPAYILSLHWIVGAKAAGSFADDPKANYESMTAWIAIVESMFGVYVGQIVTALFKKT